MSIGFPILFVMTGILLLGYLAGRQQRQTQHSANPQVKRAMTRARTIIKELQDIGAGVRRNLAIHRRSLVLFETRLCEISRSPDGPLWDELSAEAENLLKPTLALASQVAHAYDSVRQQTQLLMALTEVRTDPLTGLRNRRALDEAIQSRLAMLERYGNSFAIVVFDVDHFKQVNDEQGHLEGDRILQDVAGVLDFAVRDTDLVTRFGGEEFVVVMPETDLPGASIFAERTRARIEERLTVTVSGGVTAAWPGDDPRRLLSRADEAMYAAKEAGRNRVFHSDEDLGPQWVDPSTLPQFAPLPKDSEEPLLPAPGAANLDLDGNSVTEPLTP